MMQDHNYVWTHFDKKDNTYAICKYCNRPLSYKTTTANLKSHLQRRHGINGQDENVEENSKEENIEYEILEDSIWKDGSEEEVWEAVISECDESDEESVKGKISKLSSPCNEVTITTDISHVEQKKSSRTPQRPVWTHFKKIDDGFAICKYCGGKFSYKSSTGNLNAHLKNRHSLLFLLGEEKTADGNIVHEKGNSSVDKEAVTDTTEVKDTPRKRGQIWAHFYKINNTLAGCQYCSSKLSYKSSTGNLTVHLKKQHPSVSFGKTDNEVANNYSDQLLEEMKSGRTSVTSSEGPLCDDSTDQLNLLAPRNKYGRIWKFFDRIDSKFASCKYCDRSISYMSTTGNLTAHLIKIHPSLYSDYLNDKQINRDNDMLMTNQIKMEKSMISTSTAENSRNSTYDEVIKKTSLKSSLIWKHFNKTDSECAICKYCDLAISYKASTAELTTHLRKSHTSIYMAEQIDTDIVSSNYRTNSNATDCSDQEVTDHYFHEDIVNNDSDDETDESMKIKSKDEILELSTGSDEIIHVGEETRSKTGQIWRHFDKTGNKIASCKYCKKKLSYKTSTGNLNSHLKKKHTQVYLEQRNDSNQVTKTIKKEIWMVPTSNEGLVYTRPEPPRKGEIWTHFDKIDDTYARCRYCQSNLSYKTSTGSLTVHLRKAHTPIYMAHRINYDSNIVWICNDSKQIETKDEPQHKRQKTVENKIVSKQCCEEQARIEQDLLGLFIYDYQPLNIMDDKGFATFVKSISEYPLPSKKKICKMIPALYKRTLAELKEILARDANSICLTIECWTSSLKSTYISVTAHYTDINFERHMIMLECTRLNEGRTSEIFTQKIKTIIDKWEINTKVIFAVADNSKNIEHAIENLGWNRYGCYSHALNVIFLDALKPVEQLIENINRVIMYFKSSATAQEMLASYESRNTLEDEADKDLIQQVPEHWNGTFLMLRRFIQLHEAIQYCMALSDSEWPVFSKQEWELASQLYEVLEMFDEVTSSMLGDQYMSGSLVIIITNCLKNICGEFLEKDEYEHYKPEIKEVISCVNGSLAERFSLVEYNKDFALCTLLDPRFKCYGFHDDSAFTDIKAHLLKLLIELMDKNESKSTTQDNTDSNKDNKDVSAWDRFDKILRQKKPQANSSVKAERELQMYLDDDMMPRKNQDGQWNSPAQWWMDHKIIYPNLSEIYRTRCNIVATSVPWDRLYSKKGQILSKRRSNLEAGEVEKLVFLNANLDEKRFNYIFKEIEAIMS